MRIGIEAAYPPFASKTGNGEIVGFDYDIGNALCAQMQVKCQWVEQEFDGLVPSLPIGAQVIRYASLNEAYLDLIAGRLDAVQGDDVAVQIGFLDTPKGKGYAFAGQPFRDSKYFGNGVGVAVRTP